MSGECKDCGNVMCLCNFIKLETENNNLKELCQLRNVGGLRDQVESLTAENKKLRDCVEFYANEDNYVDMIDENQRIINDPKWVAHRCLEELKGIANG